MYIKATDKFTESRTKHQNGFNWLRFGVFIIRFDYTEHIIRHINLVLLSMTLNMALPARRFFRSSK